MSALPHLAYGAIDRAAEYAVCSTCGEHERFTCGQPCDDPCDACLDDIESQAYDPTIDELDRHAHERAHGPQI